jgi:hypothetical protein
MEIARVQMNAITMAMVTACLTPLAGLAIWSSGGTALPSSVRVVVYHIAELYL